MADGSARGQVDGIYTVILEHLRPLRRALLHQAGNIGQSVIGVIALSQGTDYSLLSEFAKASKGEDHIDILLRCADVVGDMPHAQSLFQCLRWDDAQGGKTFGSFAHVADRLLVSEFSWVVWVLVVQVDRTGTEEGHG